MKPHAPLTAISSIAGVFQTVSACIKYSNNEINAITYNHLNLPLKIHYQDGSFIQYFYNAEGAKIRKLIGKQSLKC